MAETTKDALHSADASGHISPVHLRRARQLTAAGILGVAATMPFTPEVSRLHTIKGNVIFWGFTAGLCATALGIGAIRDIRNRMRKD